MLFVKGFQKWTFIGMVKHIFEHKDDGGNNLYIFEQKVNGIHLGQCCKLGPRYTGTLCEYKLVCPD